MKCPKCQGRMQPITTAGGTVDRCDDCGGVWFDRLEMGKQADHSSEVDVGNPERGARFNSVDRIGCPRCANTPLTRMVDNDQPHIWFEACSSCGGRFLDAGEFKDLTERSLSDLVRRFTTPGRSA
jgi:Zn-finger nucleic acid-binding protein